MHLECIWLSLVCEVGTVRLFHRVFKRGRHTFDLLRVINPVFFLSFQNLDEMEISEVRTGVDSTSYLCRF